MVDELTSMRCTSYITLRESGLTLANVNGKRKLILPCQIDHQLCLPLGMSIRPTSGDRVIRLFSSTQVPLKPSSSPCESIFVPSCISTGTPRSYLKTHDGVH